MWDKEHVETLAQSILDSIKNKDKTCVYGDIRFIDDKSRASSCTNGVAASQSSNSRGFGVRLLTCGKDGRMGWGFASSSILDPDNLSFVVDEAYRNGIANQIFQPSDSAPLEFQGTEESGEFVSTVERCPFSVPLSELEGQLIELDKAMDRERMLKRCGFIMAQQQDKWFFATTGARIHQTLTYTGAMASITVSGPNGRHQSRSYPSPCGNFAAEGLEFVDKLSLADKLDGLYEEACTILDGEECPAGSFDVVLGPQMLALLVHEVAGHALELDRALNMEAAYAGASFLKPEQMGKLVYGPKMVNIVSDPTFPGAVGSYGWDDEGTRAHSVPMVKDGIHVGYLCGRASGQAAGMSSSAACRSTGWNRQPIDRMTNVNLLPGDQMTADEIIGSVKEGLYLDVPCGWSINSDRNGFRFSVEICRRIKDGKLTDWLQKGAFSSATTPEFWQKCIAIAKDTPLPAGFNNCAKGQPVQIQYTGHVVPMAVLFEGVEVGEHGTVD